MVFMDARGRYYQADKIKDPSDVFFSFPTPDMCAVLTKDPISSQEMYEKIRQIPFTKKVEEKIDEKIIL